MANMQEFWVFGYGSLMWRPGFEFRDSEPALIHGFHRSLCVYSFVHRGTPQRRGWCWVRSRRFLWHGLRVAAENGMKRSLFAGAGAGDFGLSRSDAAHPASRQRQEGRCPAYVVDRRHRQYAGKLDTGRRLALVNQGRGQSGKCTDYVLSTLDHLREMDIHDSHLEALAPGLPPQAASLTD
jgi:cation transport protein ChaC